MAATQQERADWLAEEELREEMHGFITEKMPTLTEPRARLRPDQPTTTS